MPYGSTALNLYPKESDRTSAAQAVLALTQSALSATTLMQGVTPTLDYLVAHTAAVGAAYFQLTGTGCLNAQTRTAAGKVPFADSVPHCVCGQLTLGQPLIRALKGSTGPLFVDGATPSLTPLGVASLAASPVRSGTHQLLGAVVLYTFTPHVWDTGEATLLGLVSGTIAGLAGRLAAEEQATDAREAALRAMGLALEVRDSETRGHTDRVTTMAVRLAQTFHWSASQLRAVRWGAYLHDVGKIAMPDSALLKPGPLTAREERVMHSHVAEGVRFAEALGFLPGAALRLIQDHHEHWNGQGYPAGKAGNEISPEGRLFALCDVYDALVSQRPYKAAWTPDEALAEIEAQAGRQFDPRLVRVFTGMLRRQQPMIPSA